MLKLKVEKISPNFAVINLETLSRLIEAAKKVDDVEIEEVINDLPYTGLMRLSETSGSLNFLNNEEENIYSVNDLKVRYQ